MTTRGFRSALFRVYNRERRKGFYDPGRVNRALGLLQRRDQSWRQKYATDIAAKRCDCPDSWYSREKGIVCKHLTALDIESRMTAEERDALLFVVGALSSMA